ncbi:hypothetical protein QKW60_16240 [Defluviimonas aestuarii]|uniref:hypothetical protein n=1 Tax=Albidovulum aestuarii TaxID=1130726 RepID=UPI00249BFF63|nr:hypothetical protein [Defluviimonas aestuarii]MDI3337958.1 hypothetical protein [Defluviimonas aestuarii]
MAQSTRHFADYLTGLRTMFEEEYVGEGLFETLAGYHDGVARPAFLLMAKIERAMIAVTEPAIHRNGLQIRDPESLRAEGRDEAETMRTMSWPDFFEHVVTDYPAFLDEFEQVAQLAPPCDAADAKLLIDHEVAFIDFAVACRRGKPDSMEVLESFLARIT